MPLRAIVDTQELIAPLIEDSEWERIRNEYRAKKIKLSLPCCGSDAIMRVSKLGTKHFAHKRSNSACDWKPETWQHLKAKTEIALACQTAGWQVKTEASGDGWRADVLATKGKAKVAFEFQWSRQSLEVTNQRQERYRQDGIRCCWFFKIPPDGIYGARAREDLPMFEVNLVEQDIFVALSEDDEGQPVEYSLADFVAHLLNGRIRYCDKAQITGKRKVRIVFLDYTCWKCNRPMHVYYLNSLPTDCGIDLYSFGMWEDEKVEFHPQIRAAIASFRSTEAGKHIQLGTIRKRYSKTINESYLSFGCPDCEAIVGDFFLSRDILYARMEPLESNMVFETEVIFTSPISDDYPHWCLPTNGEFCCERKPTQG